MVEEILHRFHLYEGGKNVWSLYNAVTWHQTHTGLRVTSNPVTTMLGREQKTAQMLNSNPWKSFVNA